MTDLGPLFEIETVEVRGVPTKVFTHAPPSLRAVWEGSAAHGDKDYLVYEGERITFAEAHRQVRALAAWLRAADVRQGDRVAIATRNHPEWAIAFWSTQVLGATAVPLNAWWTGPELAYGLQDSGAVVLFADGERAERIAPHLADTKVRSTVLIRGAGAVDGVPFAEAIAGPDEPVPEIDIAPDDDATIMYTSGTTGRPKGAQQTHRNFGNFLMQGVYRTTLAAMEAGPPAADAPPPLPPSTLLTFPLFHVGGLQSFLLPFTAAGGKVVLVYRWDAEQAVDIVEREQITTIAGVPTTMFQLLEVAQAKGKALESLAGISSGATLVPPELVRRIDRQFSSRAAPGNGYGLTETSGAAIANFGPAYVKNPESVGTPISPVIEVKIVSADGDEEPAGAVGEIWLKGPTVVAGYFGLPEETAAAFTNGWFHTGDLGRLDDDGNLYVVDRLKDVVIRGGENIYAAEVEAALYEHPDITEAAIIGVPHDRLGEEVGAVVRVRDGVKITEDDVREHVATRLAAFKVPAHVWLVEDELPRNASGKVLKRELREKLALDLRLGSKVYREVVGTYTIGEAAERSGFSASALRYYEGIGLVQPATRTDAGYRLYDDDTLARLAFISRAKQLGCSLEEITDLVDIWDGQRCGPVQLRFHELLTDKLAAAEHQIAELVALTDQLRHAASLLAGPATDGPCSAHAACAAISPPATGRPDLIPIYDDTKPVACTAGAAELSVRRDQVDRMRANLAGTERTKHGVVLHFPDRDDVDADLRRFTVDEKRCCEFWGFDIQRDAEGLHLRWEGPPSVSRFFDELLESIQNDRPITGFTSLL